MRAFQQTRLRLILAVWVALSLPVQAVLTVEDAAVEAASPSRFLLEAEAADPALGGDRGVVSASRLRLFNPGFFLDDDLEVEATFGLVRESDGQSMMLQTEPAEASVVVAQTFTLPPRERQGVMVSAALRPAEMLLGSQPVPGGGFGAIPWAWRGLDRAGGLCRRLAFVDSFLQHHSGRGRIPSLNVKAFAGALKVNERRIRAQPRGRRCSWQPWIRCSIAMTSNPHRSPPRRCR